MTNNLFFQFFFQFFQFILFFAIVVAFPSTEEETSTANDDGLHDKISAILNSGLLDDVCYVKCGCFRGEIFTWQIGLKIEWMPVTKLLDVMDWLTHYKCPAACGCVPKKDPGESSTTTDESTETTTTTTTPKPTPEITSPGTFQTVVQVQATDLNNKFVFFNNCVCEVRN